MGSSATTGVQVSHVAGPADWPVDLAVLLADSLFFLEVADRGVVDFSVGGAGVVVGHTDAGSSAEARVLVGDVVGAAAGLGCVAVGGREGVGKG